jgi:hypothetical protein
MWRTGVCISNNATFVRHLVQATRSRSEGNGFDSSRVLGLAWVLLAPIIIGARSCLMRDRDPMYWE